MKHYYIIIFITLLLFACGENKKPETDATKTPIKKADGKQLFMMRCITCHGNDGNAGLAGAARLGTSIYNKEQIINTVKNGQKAMPKVDLESEEEYQALADYVLTLRK